MGRIYNENIDIDMEKAQKFFENRFSKDNPAGSVMLRANADNIANLRDIKEAERIKSLIHINNQSKILDIGCGYGRLAMHFKDTVACYNGIDSSYTYINAAKEMFEDYKNVNFYRMLADNLEQELLQKDYNIIFLTGLFVYMNDAAVAKVLQSIPKFVCSNAVFYCRESVSVIDERLTLKDFPSEELQVDYNAIYRTPKEYEALFAQNLPSASIASSSLILDETTGARKETNQQYWLLNL